MTSTSIDVLHNLFDITELKTIFDKRNYSTSILLNDFYLNFDLPLFVDFFVNGIRKSHNITNHVSFHFNDKNKNMNKNMNHLRNKRCNINFDIIFDPLNFRVIFRHNTTNKYIYGDIFSLNNTLFQRNIIECIHHEQYKYLLYDLYYLFILKTIYDAYNNTSINLIFFNKSVSYVLANKKYDISYEDDIIKNELSIHKTNIKMLVDIIDQKIGIETIHSMIISLMNDINNHYCGNHNLCNDIKWQNNQLSLLDEINDVINDTLSLVLEQKYNGVIDTKLFSFNIKKTIENNYAIDGVSTIETWCKVNLPNLNIKDSFNIFKLLLQNKITHQYRSAYELFDKINKYEISIDEKDLQIINDNIEYASMLANTYIYTKELFLDILDFIVEFETSKKLPIDYVCDVIFIVYEQFYAYIENHNFSLYENFININESTIDNLKTIMIMSSQIQSRWFLYDMLPFILVNPTKLNYVDLNKLDKLIRALNSFYNKHSLGSINDINIFKIYDNKSIVDHLISTYTPVTKSFIKRQSYEEFEKQNNLMSNSENTDMDTYNINKGLSGGNRNLLNVPQTLFIITAHEYIKNVRLFYKNYDQFVMSKDDNINDIIRYETQRSMLETIDDIVTHCNIYGNNFYLNTLDIQPIINNIINPKELEVSVGGYPPSPLAQSYKPSSFQSHSSSYYKKYVKYKTKCNDIKNK